MNFSLINIFGYEMKITTKKIMLRKKIYSLYWPVDWLATMNLNCNLNISLWIISQPRQSQASTNNVVIHPIIKSVIHPLPQLTLWRRKFQTVENNASSDEINLSTHAMEILIHEDFNIVSVVHKVTTV